MIDINDFIYDILDEKTDNTTCEETLNTMTLNNDENLSDIIVTYYIQTKLKGSISREIKKIKKRDIYNILLDNSLTREKMKNHNEDEMRFTLLAAFKLVDVSKSIDNLFVESFIENYEHIDILDVFTSRMLKKISNLNSFDKNNSIINKMKTELSIERFNDFYFDKLIINSTPNNRRLIFEWISIEISKLNSTDLFKNRLLIVDLRRSKEIEKEISRNKTEDNKLRTAILSIKLSPIIRRHEKKLTSDEIATLRELNYCYLHIFNNYIKELLFMPNDITDKSLECLGENIHGFAARDPSQMKKETYIIMDKLDDIYSIDTTLETNAFLSLILGESLYEDENKYLITLLSIILIEKIAKNIYLSRNDYTEEKPMYLKDYLNYISTLNTNYYGNVVNKILFILATNDNDEGHSLRNNIIHSNKKDLSKVTAPIESISCLGLIIYIALDLNIERI